MLALLRGTGAESGSGGVNALEAAEACFRDSLVMLFTYDLLCSAALIAEWLRTEVGMKVTGPSDPVGLMVAAGKPARLEGGLK